VLETPSPSGETTTWAIRLRETGELIGTCGFAGTNMPWLRFDTVIEVGWTLGEQWWGRGLATEAASAAVSARFTTRTR
jgi:ribosomal-protein-alanine N-acetyltransferase